MARTAARRVLDAGGGLQDAWRASRAAVRDRIGSFSQDNVANTIADAALRKAADERGIPHYGQEWGGWNGDDTVPYSRVLASREEELSNPRLRFSASLRPDPNEEARFRTQLHDLIDGKLTGRTVITVGKTPVVLRRLGAQDIPLTLEAGVVRKVTEGKHDLLVEVLENLPQELHDPLMVFDSKTKPDSFVVLTEIEHKGKPVVAAVHLATRSARWKENRIASVYEKNSAGVIGSWIRSGLLKYWDKTRSLDWLQSVGLQLPEEGASRGSTSSVLTRDEIVKGASESRHLKSYRRVYRPAN